MSEASRREILMAGVTTGMLAAGSALGADGLAPSSRGKALRFAHATDIHIVGVNRAPEGWATALQAIAKLDPKPEFLVTGGDHIGDALEQRDRAAVERQWSLYHSTMADHNTLPVRPVIGNHDIWGWMIADMDVTTPGYGKAMALERLGMTRPYYSFDHGDWHFVVLDNHLRRENMYYGSLDPEQAEWLLADLSANRKPVCLFAHIPLLSVAAFHSRGHTKEDHWWVPDTWMHKDSIPLVQRLAQHNVKLCISGHLHMVDRVDFLGISFICNGSICGRWWNGPYQEFAEGFGVFDLYADGTFSHAYHTFGWRAQKA